MANEFVSEIKDIELELLALKTASEYTSVKSVETTPSQDVYTGLYRIDYATNGNEIVAMIYTANDNYTRVHPRTPGASSQIVEIESTRWNNSTQSYETFTNKMIIVSNVPVSSITRL